MPGPSATSGVSGQSGSAWFQDEEMLLGVAREQRTVTAPPVISGYDGLFEIKRGGQGVVYAATQKSTKRKVAI
jgi:hypothetical protein